MLIGIGCYEGAQTNVGPVVATGVDAVLAHRCPAVSLAKDWAECILRADDGDDANQVHPDLSTDATLVASAFSEAVRWALIIDAARMRGDYTAAVGICEWWQPGNLRAIKWRLLFETELAWRVKALGLRYYGLAVPVGNFDPWEMQALATELRAFCQAVDAINYHGYLGPWRKSLAEETDSFYLWRPLRIWVPVLRQLGIPVPPIVLGECGTYYPWKDTGLDALGAAKLHVEIANAFAIEAAKVGVNFVGAYNFGFGTIGKTMEMWDLQSTASYYGGLFKMDFVLGFKTFAEAMRSRGLDPGTPLYAEDPAVGAHEVVTTQVTTTGEFGWYKNLNDMLFVGRDRKVIAYNGGALKVA